MDKLGRDLQIIFLEIPPERILGEFVRPFPFDPKSTGDMDRRSAVVSVDDYCRYAGGRWQCWSEDENRLFFNAMEAEAGTIFHLPALCGKRYLLRTQEKLLCRFEQIGAWRDAFHAVGQDLITTAYLAYDDLRTGRHTANFSWEAVLQTDHCELRAVLSEGLAENHFHLKGSTQSFPLTWCCLMNFPNHTAAKLKEIITVDQYPGISRGERDNVLPHRKRLLLAACIRSILYMAMRDESTDVCGEFERQRNEFLSFEGTDSMVSRIRYLYGSKRKQPNRSWFCLDYAMTDDDEGHYRLLAGERRLMYHWFRRGLDGKAGEWEQRMFFLYLLIKSHFRREIIQTNQMVGFDNFETYQKRKDSVWNSFPAYEAESLYMSIRAPLDKGNVQSLEARIMQKSSPEDLLRTICNYDRSQQYFAPDRKTTEDFPAHPSWTMEPFLKDAPFFYVLHFAKQKDNRNGHDFWLRERHYDLRKTVRRNAFAMASALSRSEYLRHRIRGIDACANEIGCRPEVFATEFRFLRNFIPRRYRCCWYMGSCFPVHLSVTYHAGEDFLDIADGLRAIDEAVQFLEMRRGDRIGHALALGIDPYAHYISKRGQIVQSIQDRLDDLVWILFRGDELGIRMDIILRARLERDAQMLLDEIYPNPKNRFSLLDYYTGWHLRGDAPLLYRAGKACLTEAPIWDSYRLHMTRQGTENQRKNPWAAELYSRYHYDTEARERGRCVRVYDISPEYVDLMRLLQDKMQETLAALGIAIECNPSSNVLIGTFREYEFHPLFRFLPPDTTDRVVNGGRLNVSINTDDLGVFDTSLEFEYALTAYSLAYGMSEKGIACNFANVKKYLEDIRQNGWEQIFVK